MTSKSNESGSSRVLLITSLTAILATLAIMLAIWLIGANRAEPWQAEIVIDPSIGGEGSPYNREKFVNARIALVKSLAVLNEAIRISGFHEITFEDLYRDLDVTPSENGIQVAYRSNDPARAEKIVKSVIEAHDALIGKMTTKPKPKSGRIPRKSQISLRSQRFEISSIDSTPFEVQNGAS